MDREEPAKPFTEVDDARVRVIAELDRAMALLEQSQERPRVLHRALGRKLVRMVDALLGLWRLRRFGRGR